MTTFRQTRRGSEIPDPRLLKKAAIALRKRKRPRRHSTDEMLALWNKCLKSERKSGIHRTKPGEVNSVLYRWSTTPHRKRKKRRSPPPTGKLPLPHYSKQTRLP